MTTATTIQVSEGLARRLRRAKREWGAGSYEEVIARLLRQYEARAQIRRRRGSRPWLRWNRATDRMRFRTDE